MSISTHPRIINTFLKGEKGLWSHQQREHGSEYSIASSLAISERATLAMIPYQSQQSRIAFAIPESIPRPKNENDIYEWARTGDLDSIQQVVEVRNKIHNVAITRQNTDARYLRMVKKLLASWTEKALRFYIGLRDQGIWM